MRIKPPHETPRTGFDLWVVCDDHESKCTTPEQSGCFASLRSFAMEHGPGDEVDASRYGAIIESCLRRLGTVLVTEDGQHHD